MTLAVHSYEGVVGKIPGNAEDLPTGRRTAHWLLLPYVEQTALHEQSNVSEAAYLANAKTQLSVFIAPLDTNLPEGFMNFGGVDWAKSNYAANHTATDVPNGEVRVSFQAPGIPAKYADPNKSELIYTITSSMTELNIEIP